MCDEMDSQKNENLLNLALNTPAIQREQSLELNVGYDIEEKTWEVIVKYHGSLQELAERRIVVELSLIHISEPTRPY